MTTDAEIRDRIRKPKQGKKKVWHEPQPTDFAPGMRLCFDQTLTKTGWALLVSYGDRLLVTRGGMLKPEVSADYQSFRRTLEKAVQLEAMMEGLLTALGGDYSIVHEMPSVAGYRTESSLGGAQALYVAARHTHTAHRLRMVNKQSAYARLVGIRPMSKKHVSTTVNRLVERSKMNVRAWNQDVHDAVLLGLNDLYTGSN